MLVNIQSQRLVQRMRHESVARASNETKNLNNTIDTNIVRQTTRKNMPADTFQQITRNVFSKIRAIRFVDRNAVNNICLKVLAILISETLAI